MIEEVKVKDKDINIKLEYVKFVDEIPWEPLRELPNRLREVAKTYGKFIGVKEEDLDIDIEEPLKRVIKFIGVLVKRLYSVERRERKLKVRVERIEKLFEKELLEMED